MKAPGPMAIALFFLIAPAYLCGDAPTVKSLTGKTFEGEPLHHMEFTEFTLTYENRLDPSRNFSDFYILGKDGPYTTLRAGERRFIILQSKYSVHLLSRTDGVDDIYGSLVMPNGSWYPEGDLRPWSRVEVSSALEGHGGESLNDTDLKTCWAEGDVGPGRNSKIRLWTFRGDVRSLVVFNGCIDPQKSWLYDYYGRIRELEISLPADRVTFRVILEDGPDPQTIMLPADTDYVEISISDVYEGKMYDDTCVAGIFSSVYRNFFNQ